MASALVLTIVLGIVAGSTGARAQEADGPAQRLFADGVAAAQQNRWIDARNAFERAYELSGRPVVLINLAGAQARTGQLKEAAENYRRIVAADPSSETAAFRKAAAEVLPSIEARVPRVRLRVGGLAPGDRVAIDGAPLPLAHIGEPQLVDPGSHAITVARSGIERARIVFALSEGESHDIWLPIAAEVAVARSAGPAPNLLGVAPPGEAAARRSWWRSPWVWTAAAAVAAGAAVAIVTTHGGAQPYTGNVPPGGVTVQ